MPTVPLLYATVAELLLDMIKQQCPGRRTRCYADDTALVFNNFWEEAPTLMNIFQEFSQISGLHLNLRRCAIMPLDEGELDAFEERLVQQLPAWKDMQVPAKGNILASLWAPGRMTSHGNAEQRSFSLPRLGKERDSNTKQRHTTTLRCPHFYTLLS